MARTSIDCEVFGGRRLERVTNAMKWSKREAVGTLAFLWHESQAAKRTSGTFEEIVEWSWLGEDEEEAHRWVRALLFAKFIHDEGGLFVIHGNGAHIEALASYAERGKAGGDKKAANLKSQETPNEVGKLQLEKTKLQLEKPLLTVAASSCALPIHTFIHSSIHSTASKPPDGGEGEPVQKLAYEPVDITLADEWAEYAKSASTTVKVKREEWADTFRKMRTINKLTPERIRAMLAFVRDDDFWRGKAVSPPSLRTRSENGLLKFENVLNKMDRNGSTGQSQAYKPPERVVRRFERLEDIP